MPWTEQSIVAEFQKHITYWQSKLRLQDIDFDVSTRDEIADDRDAWCSVKRANGGANRYKCLLYIKRGWYADETQYDVWCTCAHELIHVMNWSMAYAFEPLTDHFATAQLNMAKSLMKEGNEFLAYKWEAILAKWFEADAPPKTIPE